MGLFGRRKPIPKLANEEYILAELRRMSAALESNTRTLDRLQDTIVEYFEGEEDLGTISGSSGAFSVPRSE